MPTAERADHSGLDVALVNMPYAGIERPSISIGLLQGVLVEAGVEVKSVYANLWFAERLGLRAYQFIDLTRSEDMVGEWTFRQAAFPDYAPDDEAYIAQLLERLDVRSNAREQLGVDGLRRTLMAMRAKANDFIVEAADRVLALGPRLVGCTSTFQQHLASLALLRRIRELDPSVITMMGGANCETVMGRTTHENFPWVDYIVSGEADSVIGEVVDAVLSRHNGALIEGLPDGVFQPPQRQTGYPVDPLSLDKTPRLTTRSIETAAVPQYGDYFETLAALELGDSIDPGLPVETSRGCWWGQKKHCTFCGLNGGGMAYRSRSPGQVLAQLDELHRTYGIGKFEVVDNILDMRHFDNLLPSLEQRQYKLFYETKSNLRRGHVQALVRAGVTWIQPGIESLHSNVLELMDKGAQAWMNVQLMKWAREFGLRLSWNMLSGFPGECDDDYAEMASWIPKITHLQPPGGLIHIRYDRYSPYHSRAGEYGLDLVPTRMFGFIYPLDDRQQLDQSYFFEDAQTADMSRNLSVGGRLRRPGVDAVRVALADWSKSFWKSVPAVLCEEPYEGGLRILDTRPGAAERLTVLDGAAAAVLTLCDSAQPIAAIPQRLAEGGLYSGPEEAVWDAIGSLKSRDFALEVDRRLLSLTLKGEVPGLADWSQFPGGFVRLPEYSMPQDAGAALALE